MDFHKNAEKTSEKTGQCARGSEDRRPAAEANSPKERKMLGEIDEGGETRHRRRLCFLHNQGLPKEVIFCYNTDTLISCLEKILRRIKRAFKSIVGKKEGKDRGNKKA